MAQRHEHGRLLRRDLYQRAECRRDLRRARPFEERADDPRQSANAIQARTVQRLAAIQEALIIVVQPPPVQGIGNAGGFRMMVEDRAGRGPQALQAAVGAMMGRAGADARACTQVFSLFETVDAAALSRHRPHQGADARRQRARRVRRAADLIWARPTSTTSICSAAHSA